MFFDNTNFDLVIIPYDYYSNVRFNSCKFYNKNNCIKGLHDIGFIDSASAFLEVYPKRF